MGELSPFYHTLAEVAEHQSKGDPSTILPTTLYLLSASTMTVGLTFYALGKCGIASVTYFFPTYVMLGLVGGVGIWMTTLSATVSISPSLVHGDRFWDAAATEPFLLSAGFTLGLIGLRRFVPKDRFPFLDPCYFLSVPAVFYVGLLALGVSIDDAIEGGYMFKDPDSLGGGVEEDALSPWDLWKLFDPSKVRWGAIVPASPTLIASAVLCVILVAPFIPALATFKGLVDFDMNHEFVTHGYANVLSAILSPGGLSMSLCYSTSTVYSRAGGKGKLSSALLSIVIFLTFVYGPQFVAFIPRCMAGALILDMGINLFLEGVLDQDNKCDRIEYASIWIIIITMTLFDMTSGLLAGLATAVVTHTLQSHVGKVPVRIARDASLLHSSRWRNPAALALLDDPKRGRKNIVVFILQGHIFFGNMSTLQKQMFDYLTKKKADEGGETSLVIVDFTLVVGIDSTAMSFIDKLKTRMKKKFGVSSVVFVIGSDAITSLKIQSQTHNVARPSELVEDEYSAMTFSQAEPALGGGLERMHLTRPGSFYTPQPPAVIDGKFFDTLDQALSSCEDVLIARYKPGLEKKYTDRFSYSNLLDLDDGGESAEKQVVLMLGQHCRDNDKEALGKIFNVLTREKFRKGDVLWKLGDACDTAKLLFRGSVFAFVDENDPSAFSETIKCGAFIGLRGLILDEKHEATVRCDEDTVVYSLNRFGYERLAYDSPEAARLLDLCVARYLSHRLRHVSNRIYGSKSIPL